MATKVKLIETGAVTGNIIPDGGIATGKLANDAVTTIKISDANITHAKLHTSMDLTGKTVTVATAAGSTNTTAAASTAFVQQELTTLIGGAPSTLNDLNELAAAINNDANYNSTLTTALATKLPLAGGTMSGGLNMGSQNISAINNATAVSFLSTNGYWVGGTQRINGSGNLVNIGTISSGAITSTGDITTGYAKTISMDYAPASGDYHKGMSGLNQSSGTARGLHLFNYDADSNEGINFWVGTSAAKQFAARIDSSGNVGIGTSGPSTKLTVRNDSASTSFGANNIITIQNANTTDNSRMGLAFTGNTGIGSGLALVEAQSYDQSAGHTSLNFSVYNGSWHNDMMVLKAGNVGIGTSSPVNAKLEIESSTDQGLLIQLKNTDQDSNTYMRYKDWAGQYWDTGINWANNDYYFNYGGAFRARFTNAGGLQIDGSGASTTPTLALNSTTSTTFNHSINAFNANLAGSENQLIAVGKEGSTKNSGYIGYKWIASGNNGNMLTFGHWGNDNIMNLTADGKLGIGTEGPIAQLDVRGSVSSIIAMTSAHGYSQNRNWRFVSNNFGSGNWGGFSLETSTGTGGTPSVPVWGIDINGNTGIGIGGSAGATQAAAKLDVGGTIRAADGIMFGTDTATANRLDDYEEGTFTPVVENGTYTYTHRRGHYTKIGNIVHIHIGFKLASASPGTSVGNISGLPFNSITYGSYQEPHGRIGAGGLFVTANLGSHLTFYKGNSNTILYARTSSTNTDTPVNSNSIWQAGTFIKLQMSYTVS